jgi:rSAM/selenodomain-associated transferase 1
LQKLPDFAEKNVLVVFAKAPRVGSVKSRLAHSVGAERACEIYELLLRTAAAQLAAMERVTVCFAPDDGEADLRRYFPERWQYRPQHGVDLGSRLEHAINEAFEQGADKVAVIGSDCPDVTAADIADAWAALKKNDVVFGPARDGGYWLIGMKRAQPALFRGIDWGTEKVLAQSQARAQEAGLKIALLRTLADIDTTADWEAFAQP